jgi:glycerophosphoryl diester phosphodiesterase
MGADGVELDIHVSADGVPIVHHDSTIGGMAIQRVPLPEIRARHRLGNGEPVPTLAEALATIDAGLQVFVEVKALAASDDRRVLAVLRGSAHPDRCQVHSFDHRIVQRLRAAEPALITGVLSASYPVHPVAQLRDADASSLWQQASLIDADLVAAVRAAATRLVAWTVDDPERMRALQGLGVDAICTNCPDVARQTLR